MIKILNWRKLFSEQNIIFVHLNICSSLVPALADLRSVCTLCLQLVAFLEAGFGNEMEISVRNSQWQEISGGIVSERILRHYHPGVQYELPLGLVASIELVLVRIIECLVGQGACLQCIKIRYEATPIKCFSRCTPVIKHLLQFDSIQLSAYLVDCVWTVQQLCVVGQDVLKFSCLRSVHE